MAFWFFAEWAPTVFFWSTPRKREAAKAAVVLMGVGNWFSITMHSMTRLPDCEEYTPGIKVGVLTGGRNDKLMSNHVYNTGVMLRMVAHAYDLRPGAAQDGYGFGDSTNSFLLRSCVVVLYSLAMVSSRGHYTVDVVVALWALGIAELCWPKLFVAKDGDVNYVGDKDVLGSVDRNMRTRGVVRASAQRPKSRSASVSKRK